MLWGLITIIITIIVLTLFFVITIIVFLIRDSKINKLKIDEARKLQKKECETFHNIRMEKPSDKNQRR